MSVELSAPPSPPPPEDDGAAERGRRNRFANSAVRTVAGFAVLAAILGGLVGLNSLRGGGDSDLGPTDGQRPEVGEPAPQFALRDAAGNVRQISDFRGQPVWINFWATWCGPCKRELPDIQALANEFEEEGLVVLALNLEESRDRAAAFWEELGLDLPMLLDSSGDVAEQYRLIGLPNNFFIDEDGVLRGLQHGFLTEGQMREKLAEVGVGDPQLLDSD